VIKDDIKSYKGNTFGRGRPKGSKNKFGKEMKDEFLLAYHYIGGLGALTTWAKEEKNRTEFYRMLTRLFPREIKAEINIGRAISEYSADELVEIITGEGTANEKPDAITSRS